MGHKHVSPALRSCACSTRVPTHRGSCRVTKYVYDKVGQLTSVTTAFGTPDAATVQYAYDAIGQRIGDTDARGNPTATSYGYNTSTHEQTITVTPPPFSSHTTTTTFNALGQRTKLHNARGFDTTYQYDERGRLRTTIYPDATVDEIHYDGAGQVLTRIDQALKATTLTYFDDGQLKTVTNPANQTTTYGYDAVGNLTSMLDANGHSTTFQYDARHQRTTQTLPISTIVANSTYDGVGNLSTFTDFNGKTTTYAYDALNRLTTLTPDATLAGQTPISFTFFPTGQRKTMTDASGTTSYAYTARDQLLSKATPQGTLSYTYNLAGAVQTLRSSHVNGVSVDYSYDNLNRLGTVLDNRLSAGANTTTYTYDPNSDLQSTTLPNGVLTMATYNTLDRLTRLTTTTGATTLADFNYTLLGAAGERKRVVELGGRQVDYGYDNTYRLLSETISVAAPAGVIGATYDPTGNRLTRTTTVAGIAAATATYDANDRQTGITYDNTGNTTLASGITYGYDFLNRLTSASGGIALTYDGDGTRVQATAGGVTTQYLVDDNNPTGYPQVVEELVGGIQIGTGAVVGVQFIERQRAGSWGRGWPSSHGPLLGGLQDRGNGGQTGPLLEEQAQTGLNTALGRMRMHQQGQDLALPFHGRRADHGRRGRRGLGTPRIQGRARNTVRTAETGDKTVSVRVCQHHGRPLRPLLGRATMRVNHRFLPGGWRLHYNHTTRVFFCQLTCPNCKVKSAKYLALVANPSLKS
jgi:YD repeat-containing protein